MGFLVNRSVSSTLIAVGFLIAVSTFLVACSEPTPKRDFDFASTISTWYTYDISGTIEDPLLELKLIDNRSKWEILEKGGDRMLFGTVVEDCGSRLTLSTPNGEVLTLFVDSTKSEAMLTCAREGILPQSSDPFESTRFWNSEAAATREKNDLAQRISDEANARLTGTFEATSLGYDGVERPVASGTLLAVRGNGSYTFTNKLNGFRSNPDVLSEAQAFEGTFSLSSDGTFELIRESIALDPRYETNGILADVLIDSRARYSMALSQDRISLSNERDCFMVFERT